MRIHELIQRLEPETVREILQYFREHEREVYRMTLASLAGQRNLRPVFVQRKKSDEQLAWMQKTLRLPGSAEIGEQLIQTWLLKARADMLKTFLDRIGVAHDGDGSVEDLPDALDGAKVESAVAALLERYPAQEVAVYLHMFQRQSPEGWPEIRRAIEADSRLSLDGRTGAPPGAS